MQTWKRLALISVFAAAAAGTAACVHTGPVEKPQIVDVACYSGGTPIFTEHKAREVDFYAQYTKVTKADGTIVNIGSASPCVRLPNP